MSKYDSLTTIFSPEGRLLQVENAIKNIGNAGLCIGVVTKEGIILSCEKETISKLYERDKESDKIYKIDSNIAVGVGGFASDANVLIDWCRDFCQDYFFQYKTYCPVERCVKHIANNMHYITQHGSYRPYGVGFLVAGYDKHYGYQLYSTEPSGIYNAWKAHAIGKNDQSATSSLEQYFEEGLSLEKGIEISVRVLKKSLDKNKMNPENVEIFIMTMEDGELVQKGIKEDEIKKYIGIAEKEEEKEKLEEKKKKKDF